jgi:hypothetical protein
MPAGAATFREDGASMKQIVKNVIRRSWRATPFKSSIKRYARPVVDSVLISRAMPGCWLRTFRLYRILSMHYGHLRSAATLRSVDANGDAIPWITYPALEYIKQLDFSDMTVFEYGCGGSTTFWSRLARRVDSVEDNVAFYQTFRAQLPENCTLSLEVEPERYIHAPERNGPYDVIVIDGHSRVRCSELAPRYLKEGGLIILDNSDWFVEASANLRNADLIEVDMAGMAPISDFVSTTSFYFHRQFRGRPRSGKQPVGAIGSIPKPYFPKVTGPTGQVGLAGQVGQVG